MTHVWRFEPQPVPTLGRRYPKSLSEVLEFNG